MKNITVSVDDEIYRKARITAAERDTSVSALVKEFLLSLNVETPGHQDLKEEQEALLDSIWQRHPNFSSSENLSREALHERS
ncbi:MAG: hypothetical protein JJT96_02600 [Opitutales bacterium]|nr:hypothetical protein [Opitutales bacterium]